MKGMYIMTIKMKNKGNIIKILAIMFVLVAITILSTQNTEETILTSAQGLSTKKLDGE